VLAEGATAYDAPQRFRLMERRAAEVSKPIRANSGQWRRELSSVEIAQIRERTSDLWRALGGDPDDGGYRD
jgi:hypothetical protein